MWTGKAVRWHVRYLLRKLVRLLVVRDGGHHVAVGLETADSEFAWVFGGI